MAEITVNNVRIGKNKRQDDVFKIDVITDGYSKVGAILPTKFSHNGETYEQTPGMTGEDFKAFIMAYATKLVQQSQEQKRLWEQKSEAEKEEHRQTAINNQRSQYVEIDEALIAQL